MGTIVGKELAEKIVVSKSMKEVRIHYIQPMLLDCLSNPFQGCALRENDESIDTFNRGNFLELLKYTASLSTEVAEVILENAPGNAFYISSKIQNYIMDIIGDLVRRRIREEIDESKFCIPVDESQDGSNIEQMAMVIRFVDDEGCIREQFFDAVGVEDTTAKL